MDTSVWLPLQALGTLVVVIGLAYWSYRKTRKKHDDPRDHTKSALARERPDPQFHPDADVTDPHHVTDAHPGDPGHRTDLDPDTSRAPTAADRSKIGGVSEG